MTIYINKEVTIEDYEVEIELDESEVLNEIDTDVLIEHVVDQCSASRILNKLDASDIVAHVAGDKQALASLLRAVADQLNYQ
jgi:hypothetical protein